MPQKDVSIARHFADLPASRSTGPRSNVSATSLSRS